MSFSSPHYVHYLDSVTLAAGGVVRAVLDLCSAMARQGHTVTLITWDDRDVPSNWRNDSQGTPSVVTIDRPRGGLWMTRSARSAAGEVLDQADVLQLHTPWDPCNLWFAHFAQQRGLPYVVTVHGMLDDWSMAQRRLKKRLYLTLAGRRMLEKAAVVHCTATAEKSQAQNWIRGAKIVALPYAFDTGPFEELPQPELSRTRFQIPSDNLSLVLFLSRLHPKKGVELLIEASALAKRNGEPFRLLVAGSGEAAYEEWLERRVRELNLEGLVIFTGLVGGELKLSLFRVADLLVLPTYQENFGLALIESMACGTPVVTTRGVDIWQELAAVGGTITDNNPPAILEGMRTILGDSARAKQLGDQGRQWVLNSFNEEKLVKRYQCLYETITDEKASQTDLDGSAALGVDRV